LGGGFWIKASTGYSLLADVFLFFFPTAVGIVLKNFQISFSVLDFGQRGLRGECPKSKTPYYFLCYVEKINLTKLLNIFFPSF